MTITTRQASRLRKLIKELVEAEREDEMKGAQTPDDMAEIEERLRVARKRVDHHITILRLDDFRRAP